jgi:hypothetical protein
MDVAGDIVALLQLVLIETYRQMSEDLRDYAEKVRQANARKKAIREYLAALREIKAKVIAAARKRGVEICCGGDRAATILAQLIEKHALVREVGDVEHELCIPDRVPPARVNSLALLSSEIERWDERVTAIGAESQLSNIALQSWLADQEKTIAILTNILNRLPRKWPP